MTIRRAIGDMLYALEDMRTAVLARGCVVTVAEATGWSLGPLRSGSCARLRHTEANDGQLNRGRPDRDGADRWCRTGRMSAPRLWYGTPDNDFVGIS